MDNLINVDNANQLNKIFDACNDKLIVLMYYTKNNPDCRKTKSIFEKVAINHTVSVFCIIDIDKFEGDSRFINKNSNLPKFEGFYLGNSIAASASTNDKEFENWIRMLEKHVMTQMTQYNSKPNNTMNAINMPNTINTYDANVVAQMQMQILNNAYMQNPAYAQQLMQNPTQLSMMVQNNLRLLNQNNIPIMNSATLNQNPLMNPLLNTNISQMPQMSQMPMQMPTQMPQIQQMPAQMPAQIPQQMSQSPSNNCIPNVLPTMEQMKQMFQIFQMMQQMGALNTLTGIQNFDTPSASTGACNPGSSINNTVNSTASDADTILANGDRIVSLGNGKYGLIKKN